MVAFSPQIKFVLQSSFHDTLFKEPETSDEYSRDMELSDCEFPTQIFTREDTVFSASFSKSPNDRTTPDFSSSKTDEGNLCTTVNGSDATIGFTVRFKDQNFNHLKLGHCRML